MGKAQKEIKPIHQLGLHRKEHFFNHMNSTNTQWKKGTFSLLVCFEYVIGF